MTRCKNACVSQATRFQWGWRVGVCYRYLFWEGGAHPNTVFLGASPFPGMFCIFSDKICASFPGDFQKQHCVHLISELGLRAQTAL